jgi:hypothetical protein
MSTATRNAVMAKILSMLSGITFSTPINNQNTWAIAPSNNLVLWGSLSPEQQPACYLVTHKETDDYMGNGLSRRRLELGIWCYSRADNTPGAVDLDTMMEAFESIFAVQDNYSTGNNTLGGLVYYCRIQGRVFKDPGDLDGQTLLIVPLVVEMP